MKVKGLDGRLYSWNPSTNAGESREVSSYHQESRGLLRKLFPSERILEEVSLPGTKPILFADFVLPIRKMIVEVHGEQHYKWIQFYHGTKREFIEAKKNDTKKKQWCDLNDFYYIELPYWENIDEWRNRIINFGSTTVGKEKE